MISGFQDKFSQVVSKSYPNCSSYNVGLPFVRLKSIFGEKLISLPFVDTIRIKKDKFEGFNIGLVETNMKVEVRLSEMDLTPSVESALLRKGFHKNVVKGHIVSMLTSPHDYWNRFHRHTRNDIRRALRSNLKVRRIDSLEEVRRFYSLYLAQMKSFGTPQHSLEFFKNCLEILKKNFYGLNCYYHKQLIASIILFLDEDYAYVSFSIYNPKFKHLRPNDLLYWDALKWCMEEGVKYFDIGQADLEIETPREKSLLDFKKKWLGKVYKRYYFTKNFAYNSNATATAGLKKLRIIWKRLPLSLIRRFGPLVCAQLGK